MAFGVARSEPEQKEQSAVSPVKNMQQPSSQQLKAKALCLKRPRKQLSVLLPVEFVEEGCVFQAKKSLKRALVWDREDSSSSREDIVLQPLKRMAL